MSHQYQQPLDSGAQYYPVNAASQAHLPQHTYPGSTPSAGHPAMALRGGRGGARWYQTKWVKYGVPAVLVAIIVAAVVGGVEGSKSNDDSSSSSSGSKGYNAAAAASLAAVSTDSNSNPIYATSTTAAPAAPSASGSISSVCGSDSPSWNNQSSDAYHVRTDHPKLFAPAYRWECLKENIAQDAYLSSWNATIMANATRYYGMTPVNYTEDGGLSGSGVLDIARELQLRTKHWAYAYRMTNDTKWVDRTWQELLVASGNTSQYFGETGNNWNTHHFLDLGEFTLAFAYSYDWMYDAWNQTQRDAIMWSIITLGLDWGYASYTNTTDNESFGWWQTTNGNWNCVCNGGLTLGALAISGEDPTGVAQRLLAKTVPNAQDNCAMAVQTDGTWTETSDYWYFGSTAAAQMGAGLLSATGSTQQLFDSNPNYNKTGLFHMYGTGFVQKFNYGDCGPNKYTATANAMMFFGNQFDIPMYTLYQRDRSDAPEPLAMFYYNPDVTGDWWDGLALDHHFSNENDAWASMRSSWTNTSGVYAAMKAGNMTGHQTHGDIDAGDFVLEALGQRWAGELCQNNYLDTGYFSSEGEDSQRWLYYRCRTEGQNSLVLDQLNQNVDVSPPTTYDSTGDAQNSLSYAVGNDSAVYFWTDLTAAYNGTSVKRGMRLLNARRQVLIQDEISDASAASQWRMHTNATITYSNGNRTANLALGGETLVAQILDSQSSVTFTTLQPTRYSTDPPLPSGQTDLPNPGVSVLAINIPSGTQTVEVLFSPQWPGLSSSDYVTPSSVPLSSWTLTSHQ